MNERFDRSGLDSRVGNQVIDIGIDSDDGVEGARVRITIKLKQNTFRHDDLGFARESFASNVDAKLTLVVAAGKRSLRSRP